MADQDIKEILDIDVKEPPKTPQLTKEAIIGSVKKTKKSTDVGLRRPSGMNREVYALLYSDHSTSLIPTDSGSGYRHPKARLGRKHVRPWKWMPFTNSAREDELVLYHWRRTTEEGKDYPFVQFNKKLPIPTYTDEEYTSVLQETGWSKLETDHLFELCRQFDLRFVIIQDRFDTEKFQKRSVEDLKARYYSVYNRLLKLRDPSVEDSQLISYDAPHETKRKAQLERLFNRTKEQVSHYSLYRVPIELL
ncbi:PREDICTED: DNA methyltransferase 1-associated protein 1-like [Amphimedon queenslandica]|nr:PREDICTED: DNA methyltransferase 1-associated protein 1-like [Amphimedon queenslandica]|eukprot:XP_019858517.1 PREDICTED: DNA methyltransferase 1-associated protein 1-like [Amphimedon queenslandica]